MEVFISYSGLLFNKGFHPLFDYSLPGFKRNIVVKKIVDLPACAAPGRVDLIIHHLVSNIQHPPSSIRI